jgi:hypothetical protein
MNLPKIGQSIIVRKANGLMPLSLKNTIQTVKSVAENHNCFEEESTDTTFYGTAVVFTPGLADHSYYSYYTSQWDIVPAIGDKVRAVGAVLGDYDGHECVITEILPGVTDYRLIGEFKSIQKPDDTISLDFFGWEPIDAPEVKPSEEVGIITDLQAQVDRFTEQNRVLLAKVANWEQDWDTITSALHNEADRRGWCNEYDEFVNEIESDLRIGVMPRREKDYEVSWVATVIVNIPMSRTYAAPSPEDAEQQAANDYCSGVETQDILDAIRSGDWEESDDLYREYEVEEV